MDNKYETPETNVKLAALKLLRYKALVNLADDRVCLLDEEDVNEILTVAGLPVITPDELNVKEINVLNINEDKK